MVVNLSVSSRSNSFSSVVDYSIPTLSSVDIPSASHEMLDTAPSSPSINPAPSLTFIKSDSFTKSFAVASVPGRKHYYKSRMSNGCPLVVNEDGYGVFEFLLKIQSPQDEQHETNAINFKFNCFFLCDGHGVSVNIPLNSTTPWKGSQAEQYISKLRPLIAGTVSNIIYTECQTWLSQSNFQTLLSEPSINEFTTAVSKALSQFHTHVNSAFEKIDPDLQKDNGATLTLGVSFEIDSSPHTVFFVNVGDSSMMLVDKSSGTPLKVWNRSGADEEDQICSYEDTLASYPRSLREGQSLKSVGRDYAMVKNFIRELRGDFGSMFTLYSKSSAYGLALTNSLGNRNHASCMLNRTTVYSFPSASLPPSTAAVFVSDGIKDVLSTNVISASLRSVEKSIQSVSTSGEFDIFDIVEKLVPLNSNVDKFDKQSGDVLKELVMDEEESGVKLQDSCDAIVNLARLKHSYDDMTMVVVDLFGKVSVDGESIVGPSKDNNIVVEFEFEEIDLVVQSPECILRPVSKEIKDLRSSAETQRVLEDEVDDEMDFAMHSLVPRTYDANQLEKAIEKVEDWGKQLGEESQAGMSVNLESQAVDEAEEDELDSNSLSEQSLPMSPSTKRTNSEVSQEEVVSSSFIEVVQEVSVKKQKLEQDDVENSEIQIQCGQKLRYSDSMLDFQMNKFDEPPQLNSTDSIVSLDEPVEIPEATETKFDEVKPLVEYESIESKAEQLVGNDGRQMISLDVDMETQRTPNNNHIESEDAEKERSNETEKEQQGSSSQPTEAGKNANVTPKKSLGSWGESMMGQFGSLRRTLSSGFLFSASFGSEAATPNRSQTNASVGFGFAEAETKEDESE
ncbi:hypothetical protein HK098_007065 [Nowakowskiella sp. JEL0407]|nr:hypothetical protein HK098_007065 [Nowakowskiella sp. JEL0407]